MLSSFCILGDIEKYAGRMLAYFFQNPLDKMGFFPYTIDKVDSLGHRGQLWKNLR